MLVIYAKVETKVLHFHKHMYFFVLKVKETLLTASSSTKHCLTLILQMTVVRVMAADRIRCGGDGAGAFGRCQTPRDSFQMCIDLEVEVPSSTKSLYVPDCSEEPRT